MIKNIKFYWKVLYQIINKDVINQEDYKVHYNKIANTYEKWLEKMSQHTDKIIVPEYLSNIENPNILDFACGTGYITKKLISSGINYQITAVDISQEMLRQLNDIKSETLSVINKDGIEFLKENDGKYDVIICGWALPYFEHNQLLQLFHNHLNRGGVVALITNVKGTLKNIEDVFLKVMKDNHQEVIKPMDIRLNLPKGKKGLKKWMSDNQFKEIFIDEGEEVFEFEEAEQLLEWINKTGAVAGTEQIFNDYNNVKQEVIKEISKKLYSNGKYRINHKFAYGYFIKK